MTRIPGRLSLVRVLAAAGIILLSGFHLNGIAQSSIPVGRDSVTVYAVNISGNQRTRESVIRRELLLSEGMRLPAAELESRRRESHRLLQNTALFVETSVIPCRSTGDSVAICVDVREAWYLFPAASVELADRNFNVWWDLFGASLRRVNYGLYLYHFNLTGRRDLIKVKLQEGYARKVEVSYDLPQVFGSRTLGVGFLAGYIANREVQYATSEDRQLFHRSEDRWLLERWTAQGHITYRPGTLWKHRLTLGFRDLQADSLLIQGLNREFFPHGSGRLRVLTLGLNSTIDRTDDRPYPFRGYALMFDMQKEGLSRQADRQRWWLSGIGRFYLPTGSRSGFEWIVFGQTHLQRDNQGFHEYRALGYEDFALRGYEYYVVDGLDMAAVKTSWRYRLFSRDLPLPLPDWRPIAKLRVMPLQVYGSVYTDHGWVNDPFFGGSNRLRNKPLSSWGVGLDLRVYFDKVFSIMWSFNQLGDNGVFLRSRLSFR